MNKLINIEDGWSNLFNAEGVSHFYNNDWRLVSGDTMYLDNGIFDLINVCVDPNNHERVFASSWSKGLVEINGNTVKNYFKNPRLRYEFKTFLKVNA